MVAGGAVVGAIGAARTGEVCLNGSCLWVLRTLAGAIGTLVTQIRHETRERTVSENMNRILDSFTDPMLIVARDGRIVHGNEALRLLHPGTATPGLPVHDVLPDFASFRWVAEGDGAGPLPATARRTVLRDGDGRDRPVEAQVTPARWDDAPAEVVVCRDISSRLALTGERERLVTAINQLVETIVITDADGRIEYVNPSFTRLTGWPAAEVLGMNPRILKSGVQDDAFYRDRYGAPLWALPGVRHEHGARADMILEPGRSAPFENASAFAFETSRAPEAALHVDRHGGVLLTCDSVQNWGAADRFFSPACAKIFKAQGLFQPTNISHVWRDATGVRAMDFARLLERSFRHLISAHGPPILGDAHARLTAAVERVYGG